MDLRDQAARPGEGLDRGGPFCPLRFFDWPHPRQFALENDAVFSASKAFLNLLVECVQSSRVAFYGPKSNLFGGSRSAGVAAHSTEASRRPRGLRFFRTALDAHLVPAALDIFA
jgi:hypothetical protein